MCGGIPTKFTIPPGQTPKVNQANINSQINPELEPPWAQTHDMMVGDSDGVDNTLGDERECLQPAALVTVNEVRCLAHTAKRIRIKVVWQIPSHW